MIIYFIYFQNVSHRLANLRVMRHLKITTMKKLINVFKNDKVIKGLLITCVVSLLGYILFNVIYKIYCEGHFSKNEITFVIGSIKDVFQIMFFSIVACVTILSYMQARKTLFTPIKTETFKMQIKSFEDILAFFQSKTETDFTHQFDFDFMVAANFRLMFTDYIKTFFKNEIKINEEPIKDLYAKFAGATITQSYMEKNFHLPEYFEKTQKKEKEEITNPALILQSWRDYEYGQVHFSKTFIDETEKLNKLIASPLLTTELKNKLKSFKEKVQGNHILIGVTLTELAQELPTKFPTAKSIENLEMTGVWNKFNSKKEDLEPNAKEILDYIRQYLRIENLIE